MKRLPTQLSALCVVLTFACGSTPTQDTGTTGLSPTLTETCEALLTRADCESTTVEDYPTGQCAWVCLRTVTDADGCEYTSEDRCMAFQ